MIKVNNLCKSFDKNQVLKGVDLLIPEGNITAVLGPNGSGKTTLLKTLLGLVKPDDGGIFWQEKIAHGDYEYRKHIGYLPQIARFPENLRVRELFTMIQDIRQQSSELDPLLDAFKLRPLLNDKLRYLSGGTRQKINTTLTFMFDSKLFILDEPSVGLDPIAMIQLKELINRKQKEGKTILFTSHILSLVEELAQQIIFLLDGRIYFQGTVQELRKLHGEHNVERAIARLLELTGNKEMDQPVQPNASA